LVGHFTEDLDNDSAVGRGLRVDIGNKDFAVFEGELFNFAIDFLFSGWWWRV
jgi:hypothetical protein